MQVVVLGGGIAGLESAIYLRKYGFEVTLVSDREYLYLYPTSIWIPTGEYDFEDVALPLKRFANVHRFTLIIDPVTKIDTAQKSVTLATQTLQYDQLIIALGYAKMQPPGVEHAPSICGKPGESLQLKSRLQTLVSKGGGTISIGFGGNPHDTSAVRGGPAFEVIFNLHTYLKRKGMRKHFTLNFFAPMARPGQKMGEKNVDSMIEMFRRSDIRMHFGKKIQGFNSQGVIFEDESQLSSDMMMFIAGGTGHPIAKAGNLPLSEAGFIKIDEFCQVEGFDDIYAIGDVAAIEGVEWRAKQGHLAEAMGRAAAFNLKQKREGKSERASYRAHMNIVCLMDTGNGAALIYRSTKRTLMIPLPIIGHWLKKGWGWYYKNSKLGRFPRIPGM